MVNDPVAVYKNGSIYGVLISDTKVSNFNSSKVMAKVRVVYGKPRVTVKVTGSLALILCCLKIQLHSWNKYIKYEVSIFNCSVIMAKIITIYRKKGQGHKVTDLENCCLNK